MNQETEVYLIHINIMVPVNLFSLLGIIPQDKGQSIQYLMLKIREMMISCFHRLTAHIDYSRTEEQVNQETEVYRYHMNMKILVNLVCPH